MKALWHMDSKVSELRLGDLVIRENQISVRSSYSLVSAGTESLIARGAVAASMEEYMRVPNMAGGFALPIKYGYSVVGMIGDDQRVHTMHPHQDELAVDPASLYRLPNALPLDRACLISNMETVINAIWDSQPRPSDKIAICGFGGIGALLATTLRLHHDVNVDIIEVNEWRCSKAKGLGWELSDKNRTYDIIYHTTASEQGLQSCIDALNEEGKVIELSWYGDKQVKLSLGRNFHYKRLQIISSQVSVIPKGMRDRYDYKTRKDLAVQYLLNDSYDDLITNIIPFEDSPDFFNQLRSGDQGNGLIWLIKY